MHSHPVLRRAAAASSFLAASSRAHRPAQPSALRRPSHLAAPPCSRRKPRLPPLVGWRAESVGRGVRQYPLLPNPATPPNPPLHHTLLTPSTTLAPPLNRPAQAPTSPAQAGRPECHANVWLSSVTAERRSQRHDHNILRQGDKRLLPSPPPPPVQLVSPNRRSSS